MLSLLASVICGEMVSFLCNVQNKNEEIKRKVETDNDIGRVPSAISIPGQGWVGGVQNCQPRQA